MTLKEVLEKHMGEMAKIGSGNSFVYCGRIDEYLPELLDSMTVDEHDRLMDRLRKFETHIDRYERIWAQKLESIMDVFYKTVHTKHWSMDVIEEKHKKLLERYEADKADDLRSTQRNIDIINKTLERWTKYTEREVKEIYPSLEKGIIIIFKGRENGRYWTYEEYKEVNG